MIHKRTLYRVAAILLAVVFCFPAFECSALAAQDGMIRVKLTRLGTRQSISFRTNCAYAIGGSTGRRIPSGANCTVTLSGGGLTLTVNGAQAAAGVSLELRRGSSGGANGATFTSPSYSGVYPGDLLFSVSSGSIQTVLRAYIEDYVVGVVACEMGNSFPTEALKAQAIAARTYALMVKKSSGSYDLVDNTSAQAFRGYNTGSNVVAAVNATRGMVAYYNGSMARLYYAASNGGQTELAGNVWTSNLPYLVQKDDPYDYENTASVKKSYTFRRDFSANSLPDSVEDAMRSAVAAEFTKNGLSTAASGVIIESIDGIALHSPNYPAPSRTYTKARFTVTARAGSSGARSVSFDLATYDLLEGALGLGINSSDNETYEVTETSAGFTLTARRFGHGVGMSQRGAQQMASKYGMSYRDILTFYFPGIEVRTLEFTDTTGNFSGGTAGGEENPESTQPPVESTGIYAVVRLSDSSSRLNLRAQPSASSSVVGKLAHGTRVEVLETRGDWARILYAGATGYVMKSYLQLEESVPVPTPTAGVSPGQWATLTLSSTSGRMHVRQGPSTSTPSLDILSHGARVEVLGETGEWSNIRANGVVGYVKTQYLVFDAAATATPTPAPTAGAPSGQWATLNLGSSSGRMHVRQGPSTSTPSLDIIAHGARVEVLGEVGEWSNIRVNGVVGYVKTQYLVFGAQPAEDEEEDLPLFGGSETGESGGASYATVKLSSSSSQLNVRASASTASRVVARLSHGFRVEVLGVSGDWVKIRALGVEGYVARAYLALEGEEEEPGEEELPWFGESQPETTPAPTQGAASQPVLFYAVVVLSEPESTLSIREYASTSAQRIGRAANGMVLEVLEYSDGWAKVRWQGQVGFASRAYLQRPAYTAVAQEDVAVYAQPSFGAAAIGRVDAGTRVAVDETRDGWAHVFYKGEWGYALMAGFKPD
ncbi:MAG TPA: SH3 domain-containing protein [Candidatus Ornithocaccomicrobium faecavium]|uniref:SH3 domain-containing protein n=1 Tax=Candidatus Ornithocaccomicrobium faecavium TaxID=2840890 RepID=A0A9D1TDF0_9FIRM|nr:SH3 domain-containing protein [Candidatus Ornithocaccomicrobium faecavium]